MLSAAMATAQAARSSRDLNSRIIVDGRILPESIHPPRPGGEKKGKGVAPFPFSSYQATILMRNRATPPEIAPMVAPFLPPAIAPTAVPIPVVAAIIKASFCHD